MMKTRDVKFNMVFSGMKWLASKKPLKICLMFNEIQPVTKAPIRVLFYKKKHFPFQQTKKQKKLCGNAVSTLFVFIAVLLVDFHHKNHKITGKQVSYIRTCAHVRG